MRNMKMIDIIYYLNTSWYFVTAFLFITIYLGLLSEILLGFIQLLSSVLLLFYWKSLSIEQRKKIYLYWIMVAFYFSFWLLNWDFMNEWVLFLVCIGAIPMGIGYYFIKLLKLIKDSL